MSRTSTDSECEHEKIKKPKLEISSTLVWFRSDLRILDNMALYRSQVLQNPVICLFVISPQEWKNHDYSPSKVDFILRNLSKLKGKLKELGIPLVIMLEPVPKNVPDTVLRVATQVNAKNIFWNIEYEVNEGKRDSAVRNLFEQQGVKVYELHDQCIIQPGTVRTKEGKIYHVFTPFKNTWVSHVYKNPALLTINSIKKQATVFTNELHSFVEAHSTIPSCKDIGFELKGLSIDLAKDWPAGEEEAMARLQKFLSQRSSKYDVDRNFPIKYGTSRLSAYLSIGVISPRVCMNEAKNLNGGKLDTGISGLTVWISELIWREFYRHILFAYPHVCKNKAFKPEMDSIPWSYDDEKFSRWCEGKTGYPIVDASMRQLNQTGWMHNRLRMIVSMFLTKHLLIDWRLGEKYFMQHLIDGDFASNNGGWQWSSSTGTDSQPYFRIFNPLLQSEKFDADGEFIKKYVPELAHLSSKTIHDPHGKLSPTAFSNLGYPKPIVDHKKARELCLETFKSTLAKFKK